MTDPLHVLIVDDEPRIRNMLRRYLVEEGFKVSDAGDGAGMRAVLAREVMVRGSGYVFATAAVAITLPSTNVRSPRSYDG
jgi:DNA-binding NtrC family response regulator